MPRPARPDLPLAAAPGPLLDLVRAAAADRDLWSPAVRFDAARRHWRRLLAAPDVDLWLLTWLPDQSTDLHDHGGDVGVPRATDLAGGVRAWADAGLPIVPGGTPAGSRTPSDAPGPARPPDRALPHQEERTHL